MTARENHELSEFIKETFLELKDYFDLQVRYNKLIAAKKTGEISSFFTLFLIMGFLAAFFFLIASFAFVFWYSRNDPSLRWVGFLLVLAFYSFMGIVVYVFREKIIFKPLRKFISQVFFDEEERVFKEEIQKKIDEQGDVDVIVKETVLDLSDPQTFNIAKEIEKTKIKYKEKRIQAKLEEAKVKFDFFNLAKIAVNSLKDHYLTVAMASRVAFKAIKYLRPKKKNKKMIKEKKSGK